MKFESCKGGTCEYGVRMSEKKQGCGKSLAGCGCMLMLLGIAIPLVLFAIGVIGAAAKKH